MHGFVQLDTAELRKRQLSILDLVDSICRDHGITYYLYAGTLLGALRHSGYIPWDDDIDLAMMREDYERFRAVIDDPARRDLVAMSPGSESDNVLPFLKVGMPGTVLIDDGAGGLQTLINIDIFPLDDVPTSYRERVRKASGRFVTRIIEASLSPLGSGWRRPVRVCARRLTSRVSRAEMSRFVDKAARSGTRVRGSMVQMAVWGNDPQIPRAWFGRGVERPFEGRMLPCPVEAERLLAATYGPTWEDVPPPGQRVTHAFRAFARASADS